MNNPSPFLRSNRHTMAQAFNNSCCGVCNDLIVTPTRSRLTFIEPFPEIGFFTSKFAVAEKYKTIDSAGLLYFLENSEEVAEKYYKGVVDGETIYEISKKILLSRLNGVQAELIAKRYLFWKVKKCSLCLTSVGRSRFCKGCGARVDSEEMSAILKALKWRNCRVGQIDKWQEEYTEEISEDV